MSVPSADTLFQKLSSQSFLERRGLGNEVPIFIQTYEPRQGATMRSVARSVIAKLRKVGVQTVEIDLFQELLGKLRDLGRLDQLLERETQFPRAALRETLGNLADPERHIVPRVVERMQAPGTQLTLISGVGSVYPFLRVHSLLEAIQPAMMPHPVVIFFPGEYSFSPGKGSQLRLFGAASVQDSGYYRAFNLNHYLPS
jgi:hypothetical protein